MPSSTREIQFRPMRLRGQQVDSVRGLADCIIDESDEHVQRTPLAQKEQREDFQLSCDALNIWRMYRRLDEERIGDADEIRQRLTEIICQRRDYDPDEFQFALAATKDRARSAFGLGPLQQAAMRSQCVDFRLLVEDLKNSKVATELSAISWQLQQDVGETNIYLPIEQLRTILGRRKVVISGAVRRLVDCGLLRLVNERYHTRRAREYVFVGEQGRHFEIGPRSADHD